MQNSFGLRPMDSSDSHAIHALHERASAESLFYRYMRQYQPNFYDAKRIADCGQGLVLSNETGAIIGYAYFVVSKIISTQAEFAILIEDSYQGQGLGRYLISQLSHYAQVQGIEQLKASLHGSNNIMKHLVHSTGYPVESAWDYGEYIVTLNLSMKNRSKFTEPERG